MERSLRGAPSAWETFNDRRRSTSRGSELREVIDRCGSKRVFGRCMTFNRFAGLGTLHALRTLVFARAPLGCDVSRAGNGMSAMRVLRFASAARAGSVSRPSSLWRPTKCVWMFGRRVKGGVEPLALWQAVRQGALGRRRTFDRLVEQFLPGIYDP